MMTPRTVIVYMLIFNVVSGTLIGALYGVSLAFELYADGGIVMVLIGIVNFAGFGSSAGLAIGIANGIPMWLIVRNQRLSSVVQVRLCYLTNVSIAFFAVILLSIPMRSITLEAIGWLCAAFLLTLLSSLAATRWYFQQYPPRKRKQK